MERDAEHLCQLAYDVVIDQPSWELSLWQDGRCKRYEVYWDEERGSRAFKKCVGASA